MAVDLADTTVIDPVYLPFTPDDLGDHFLVDKDGHLAYFQESARRYHQFLADHPDRNGIPIGKARIPCQIEKDERFWTATAMKRLTGSPNRIEILAALLSRTFGPRPPLPGLTDWASCLDGDLRLIFEATIPSPQAYVEWLRENIRSRHLIPYVIHAAQRSLAQTLEGATHVDALVVNVDNGFSILIESKVLSDISTTVSFDGFRNQLARSLDVLLGPNERPEPPLKFRQPERSLFMLLTPRCFRDQPESRLYGWLFNDYKTKADALKRDLPHRENSELHGLSRKIGWLTFEEIGEALPAACPWLVP